MIHMQRLEALLLEPNETLEAEYKSWLDFGEQEHRGTLAKAAIALANEGGGFLVLGFDDGGPSLLPTTRPSGQARLDQDSVNDAVRKFAELCFHRTLTHVVHPITGAVHPVIVVPGGQELAKMRRRG